MSLPRTSAKPVSCRYVKTGTHAIVKGDANRHFPVILAAVAAGADDHPTVQHLGTTDNAAIWGELLTVDEANEQCTVLPKGLMYFRATEAYAGTANGEIAIGSATAKTAKVSTVSQAMTHNGAEVEGGFSITEGAVTVHILKCRR